MVVQSVPVNEAQKMYFRVSGDLILEGGAADDLTLHGGRGDFRVEQMESQVAVVCSGDLRAVLPDKGQVVVERASGSVRVQGVSCDLKMERVSGDLNVDGAENLWVEQVNGQAVVRNVRGSLLLGKVGGDLVGEDIGTLTASRVGGDACLRQVGLGGDLYCSGDLWVAPTQCALSTVKLTAGGDAMVHLLPEFNAEVQLNSNEREIHLNFGGQYSELNVKQHLLALGVGGPQLTISTGGDLMLTDQEWDDESIRMHLDQAAAGQPGPMGLKIEKFDRKMRGKIGRKLGRMARKGLFVPPIPPEPKMGFGPLRRGVPAEPREGVSSEERLMVLQMLQEGKINAEQADLLLSALRS